jgi:prepilin-type N-terminal cleavage/methylation domain-containing protein
MTSRKNRGFPLLELMIVIVIGLTMASVSFIALMPLFKENHVDQAYDTTLSVLRNYRNLSVIQTSRFIITWPTNSTMQVQYWAYVPPPGVSPAPQFVATYNLPTDMQFATQTGFPSPGPDGFGGGNVAEYFQTVSTGATSTCAIVASGNPCLIFYPDGSARDDAGNYINGVVYMTRPTSNVYSSRAVDVYGTTGRVRGWRLYNESGSNTWVQQ